LTGWSVTGAEKIPWLPAEINGDRTKRAVEKTAGVVDELVPTWPRDAVARARGIQPGKCFGPWPRNVAVKLKSRSTREINSRAYEQSLTASIGPKFLISIAPGRLTQQEN